MNGLNVSKSKIFQQNIATIKKYRDDFYRVTLHRVKRIGGYEEIKGTGGDKGKIEKTEEAYDATKLATNIARAKGKIFEIALANPWTWFATFTLNPEKYDRTELSSYKKLSVWIRNYNRLHRVTIKFLIVPELHEDGKSWHFHGLLEGLPKEHLEEFKEGQKIPIKILLELKKRHQIYNWPAYQKAFGFVTISEIRNGIAVSKYITKYVSKALDNTSIDFRKHLYYCSQGLKRAELIYEGQLTKDLDYDYKNDYVKIKTVKSLNEAMQYFVDE